MSSRTPRTAVHRLAGACALLPLSLAAQAQPASPDAAPACAPPASYPAARLHAYAEQGAENLRRFVEPRRFILQVDVQEVMAWARRIDAERAACLRAAAKDEGIVETQADVR